MSDWDDGACDGEDTRDAKADFRGVVGRIFCEGLEPWNVARELVRLRNEVGGVAAERSGLWTSQRPHGRMRVLYQAAMQLPPPCDGIRRLDRIEEHVRRVWRMVYARARAQGKSTDVARCAADPDYAVCPKVARGLVMGLIYAQDPDARDHVRAVRRVYAITFAWWPGVIGFAGMSDLAALNGETRAAVSARVTSITDEYGLWMPGMRTASARAASSEARRRYVARIRSRKMEVAS